MAYTNGNVYRHEITRVVCDSCANAGAVPFREHREPRSGETVKIQERPWCWYPRYGGPCDLCGANC